MTIESNSSDEEFSSDVSVRSDEQHDDDDDGSSYTSNSDDEPEINLNNHREDISDTLLDDSNNSETEEDSQSEASSDDSSSQEDQGTIPLAERIKRQKDKKIDMFELRNRKSKALKVVANHLTKTKKAPNEESKSGPVDESVKEVKKKSKDAPTEASSKRSDFEKNRKKTLRLNENGLGVTIGANRYKPRDPRMSSLTGYLDQDNFENKYSFLQEIQGKEIENLKKRIAAMKTPGKKGQRHRKQLGLNGSDSLQEDQEKLKILLQKKAEYERQQIDRAASKAVRQKLKEDVVDGKSGVYFPKRKEMKRMHLEAKFEEIRKRGGDSAVDKIVAKRRKKNKSRDAAILGGSKR